jgi:hypothetical protein
MARAIAAPGLYSGSAMAVSQAEVPIFGKEPELVSGNRDNTGHPGTALCPVKYSYLTTEGYRSGSHWRWFESENAHEVKIGDSVRLCYDPSETARSVLVGTMENSWT